MKNSDFNIIQAPRNLTKFIKDEITIIAGNFTYRNAKHYLDNPHAASAQFLCSGVKYHVENTRGIPTVEDWYWDELLPKFQMLSLYKNDT